MKIIKAVLTGIISAIEFSVVGYCKVLEEANNAPMRLKND